MANNAPSVMREISCDGELRLEHQGRTLQLTANCSNLQLTAPSLAILRQAWQSLPIPQPRQHAARMLHDAGLQLLVNVKQIEVARMGAGVQANWLSGLAGLPGASVSLSGLLRAFVS
jgi:hypothetical protein